MCTEEEDFRTLAVVQKAKRGELQNHMKTKNADSRHGRVVDLSEPLAAVLRDFVGGRTAGLVFRKPDGSQLMQRDILRHSLHPILHDWESFCRRLCVARHESAQGRRGEADQSQRQGDSPPLPRSRRKDLTAAAALGKEKKNKHSSWR